MDFTEVVLGRRSIRRFREDPVDRAHIERLLQAAFAGPIGTREECRYFVVLIGEEKQRLVDDVLEPGLRQLAEALPDCAARETVRFTERLLPVLRQAPVVIAACMELLDREESLALPTVSAAVENLLLAAHDLGLGACWMTGATYLAEDVREHLGLPDKQLVALLPLGYPAEEPRRSPRPARVDWRGFAEETPPAPPPAARPTGLPEWAHTGPEEAAPILVADDRLSTREALREALTAAGHTVHEADSLGAALTIVREHPVSLAILDSLLPGDRASPAARLREAAGTYLPVLLTAGAYHLEDKARALVVGADGFLGKPVRWPELLGQVRSLLRTKRLYDDLEAARRELQETMRHREKLTGMIVHDLRSPLSSIVGSLEYVLSDEGSRLAESSAELLSLSLGSGNTLLGMVNDLLDVSKMSEVGLPLERKPVGLHEIATSAAEQLRRLAEAKLLTLSVEVPEDLPPVIGDRAKLQRVLVNLTANALKFTPARGSVSLRAHLDTNRNEVVVEVVDTGIGIPEEDRERVFELFTQVESDSEERRQGTGLGLAFCKMVTDAHGGHITIDSEVGRGSTFAVHLPLGSIP